LDLDFIHLDIRLFVNKSFKNVKYLERGEKTPRMDLKGDSAGIFFFSDDLVAEIAEVSFRF
jgi:hypothetical protein